MDVVRTYLEMKEPEALQAPAVLPAGVRVEQRTLGPDEYRYFYTEVGRPYRWTDRLGWTDETLQEYLTRPALSLYMLLVEATPAGFFELFVDSNRDIEIKYFGLLPAFVGRGLGTHLLAAAVRRAWSLGADRVWLHTCTLDHPAALPNYLDRGFTVVRTETYQVEA